MFYKLLTKGVSSTFVKVLMYWYSRLKSAVLWNSVLGESFVVFCGVRQGGVLSPLLFSFYIDDLIFDLRHSGCGVYVGSIFLGCLLYADDIILISGSCTGLQHMVNVCTAYGLRWDICFNPLKSQCITFGGKQPLAFNLLLNHSVVQWVSKLKYLGCYFIENNSRIDTSNGIRKFYGNFNNVMAVARRGLSEIATVHLVKTYCLPSVMYGGEVWSLSKAEYQKMNVMWNNCFRKIFNCCWRENVSPLLFYCKVLPLSHAIDQRIILFWKKLLVCDNASVRFLANFNRNHVRMFLSKYKIPSLNFSVNELKYRIWKDFVDDCVSHCKIVF